MKNLESILVALKAKKVGLSWMARCPAHNDRTPSLSIRQLPSGKILFHCFAGCSYSDIQQAINDHQKRSLYGKY